MKAEVQKLKQGRRKTRKTTLHPSIAALLHTLWVFAKHEQHKKHPEKAALAANFGAITSQLPLAARLKMGEERGKVFGYVGVNGRRRKEKGKGLCGY